MRLPKLIPEPISAVTYPCQGEPQEVTRRGKPVVVVVAFEEYQRLCKRDAENTPSFVDHLLAIPRGSEDDGFELPCRTRDYTPRAVDF